MTRCVKKILFRGLFSIRILVFGISNVLKDIQGWVIHCEPVNNFYLITYASYSFFFDLKVNIIDILMQNYHFVNE